MTLFSTCFSDHSKRKSGDCWNEIAGAEIVPNAAINVLFLSLIRKPLKVFPINAVSDDSALICDR
jgi:hypothetical protein